MALFKRARSAAPLLQSWSGRLQSTLVPAICDVRQLALPVCFVGVKGWDREQGIESWKTWSRLFAKAGYCSTLVELDSPSGEAATTSEGVLSALEAQLSKELAGTSASYPPLLISSGLSTLVAQQYVSSHPLSGLLLVDPVAESKANEQAPTHFPTPLPDFTFEPEFPLAVMASSQETLGKAGERLLVQHGEVEGGEVRAIIGEKDASGFETAVAWMDENGL